MDATIKHPTMTVDVRPGDRLELGGAVLVEMVAKSGKVARLRVTAPREIRVRKIDNQHELAATTPD